MGKSSFCVFSFLLLNCLNANIEYIRKYEVNFPIDQCVTITKNVKSAIITGSFDNANFNNTDFTNNTLSNQDKAEYCRIDLEFPMYGVRVDFVDWNQSDQCNKGNFLKILSGRDPIMRLTANTYLHAYTYSCIQDVPPRPMYLKYSAISIRLYSSLAGNSSFRIVLTPFELASRRGQCSNDYIYYGFNLPREDTSNFKKWDEGVCYDRGVICDGVPNVSYNNDEQNCDSISYMKIYVIIAIIFVVIILISIIIRYRIKQLRRQKKRKFRNQQNAIYNSNNAKGEDETMLSDDNAMQEAECPGETDGVILVSKRDRVADSDLSPILGSLAGDGESSRVDTPTGDALTTPPGDALTTPPGDDTLPPLDAGEPLTRENTPPMLPDSSPPTYADIVKAV